MNEFDEWIGAGGRVTRLQASNGVDGGSEFPRWLADGITGVRCGLSVEAAADLQTGVTQERKQQRPQFVYGCGSAQPRVVATGCTVAARTMSRKSLFDMIEEFLKSVVGLWDRW